MWKIRKLRNKDLYQLKNIKTQEIHSKHSTLENAKKQLRLLHRLDKQKEIDKIKFPINPFAELYSYVPGNIL
jgi:hypothetical protein